VDSAAAPAGWTVRDLRAEERDELAERVAASWGSPLIVSRGQLHDVRELPCLVATDPAGEWLGIATYRFEAGECELVLLEALSRWRGVGSALLSAVTERARAVGCRRLWLITTNSNVDALRFYQRRGMRLVHVWVDAIATSRRLKPEIPLIGDYGIPITDELELERQLD
jgi:GNAT superfamily N-acetyltransferase